MITTILVNAFTFIGVLLYQYFWKIRVLDKQKIEIEEKVKSNHAKDIEGLKSIYVQEQDKIKHTLDKVLTIELQHITEERRALANFIEYYTRWTFKVAKIKIDNLDIVNFKRIEELVDSVNDEYLLNLTIEKAKILLLINDRIITAETVKLFNAVESYKNELIKNLMDIYTLFYQQEITGYQYESFDDEGSFIGTDYSVNNAFKIKPLKENFKNEGLMRIPELFEEIQKFAITSKNYLTSSDSIAKK